MSDHKSPSQRRESSAIALAAIKSDKGSKAVHNVSKLHANAGNDGTSINGGNNLTNSTPSNLLLDCSFCNNKFHMDNIGNGEQWL